MRGGDGALPDIVGVLPDVAGVLPDDIPGVCCGGTCGAPRLSVSLASGGVRLLARCGGWSDWELCDGCCGVGGGRGGGALGCD